MKKQLQTFITLFMAVSICSLSLFAQVEQYCKVKVFADKSKLQQMAKTGIDIREGTHYPGKYLICDYSEDEIAKIQELGLEYEILIEDVSKFYAERNEGLSINPDDYKGVSEWEVPENFEFGSMGGHCTYDEIVSHLDNMVNLFPDLIAVKESLDQSIEGRELWMVKISDNPNINETEPELLYTAIHHAREPAGVMTLLFYMYYLLENYDNNPTIQWVVDNSEMYFIPVVNPDGYIYNEQKFPNGGGMWRKNRKDNGIPGCEGVDLNRNYGYMWGYDNIGSSPDPCSYQFRGDSAFSEPETIAVRDFCEVHEIKIALNYHCYGTWLLYPWAHKPDPCPDLELYDAYSDLMIVDNYYYYVWYVSNGDSDDWMYGEQTTKEKIFAFTPELGNEDDGFWCAVDRIIPIAQENMIMNIRAVQLSGNYATINETGPIIYEESSGDFNFEITRIGLEDGGNFSVHLEPISNVIESVGDPVTFSNLDTLETQQGSIPFELHSWVIPGTQFQFILSLDNGDYLISDTITKVYGEAEVIFEDDCSSMDFWLSPTWNSTTSNFFSPPSSITDSPDGNYSNSSTSFIILIEDINLPDNTCAVLNFNARWEIEKVYDNVELQIATNGFNWTPLEGIYTNIGNNSQTVGKPIYDGFQTQWVHEEINLQNYIGNTVNFRYILNSSVDANEDGFYFDDFKVEIVDLATGEEEIEYIDYKIVLSNPFPNPAKDKVRFDVFNPDLDTMDFEVFNCTGQKVHSIVIKEKNQIIVIDICKWEPGIYFCTLKTNAGIQTKKMIKLD